MREKEQQIRDQQLLENSKNNEKKRFWQEANFRQRTKPVCAEYVGKAIDDNSITRLIAEKFSSVTSAGSNTDAAECKLENLNCEFHLSLEDVTSAT